MACVEFYGTEASGLKDTMSESCLAYTWRAEKKNGGVVALLDPVGDGSFHFGVKTVCGEFHSVLVAKKGGLFGA
jgi:hypothetical protein